MSEHANLHDVPQTRDCQSNLGLRRCRSDEFYLERMKDILAVSSSRRPPSELVEVVDNIFMGSQKHADDFELLQHYGITHVINCAGSRLMNCNLDQTQCVSTSLYPEEAGISECLVLGAVDHEEYDISMHFDKAIDFLDGVERSRGRALVHCNLGVNRSGAVLAAYLMTRYKSTLLNVVGFLKRKRSVVLSNRGFRRQLISFARQRGFLDAPLLPATTEPPRFKEEKAIAESFNNNSVIERTSVVRFQVDNRPPVGEEIDLNSNILSNKNVSTISTFKSKFQTFSRPQTADLSERFWSLPRSIARRVKSRCKISDPQSRQSDLHSNLDPVYEHVEGEMYNKEINHEQTVPSHKTYSSDLNLSKSIKGSRSFLSFFKLPKQRTKSSFYYDVGSLHHSSSCTSFSEDSDFTVLTSAMRPLKISTSTDTNICPPVLDCRSQSCDQ